MDWFNYYGLIIMAVIMIPNIIFAVKNKQNKVDEYINKAAYITEQIGRYGCFVFMIFNIPYTYIGFCFRYAEIVYITINAVLLLIYCSAWIVLRNNSGLLKALTLSIVPTVIFLFSAIVIASTLLFVFAIVFGAAHILISVKNV